MLYTILSTCNHKRSFIRIYHNVVWRKTMLLNIIYMWFVANMWVYSHWAIVNTKVMSLSERPLVISMLNSHSTRGNSRKIPTFFVCFFLVWIALNATGFKPISFLVIHWLIFLCLRHILHCQTEMFFLNGVTVVVYDCAKVEKIFPDVTLSW